MTTHRLIQGMVLLSVLGFFGLEARAEPMLLVEIHQEGFAQRNFVGEPLYMAFVTEVTDHTTQAIFGDTYEETDVGITFNAAPETVVGVEAAFHAPGGRFWLDQSGFTPFPLGVDQIWNPPPTVVTTTLHVPRLGTGLTGYNLSGVTQTIDRLDYIQSGREIYADQAQTIRLYGQPVPEPAATYFLLIGHAVWLFIKRWRIS